MPSTHSACDPLEVIFWDIFGMDSGLSSAVVLSFIIVIISLSLSKQSLIQCKRKKPIPVNLRLSIPSIFRSKLFIDHVNI